MNRSLVDIANEKVPIEKVCDLLGMDAPDLSYMKSPKMYCPFGGIHSDGGAEKSFRLFGETNSAYCHGCVKRWSSVSLYADAKDMRWPEAAEFLLDHFEISKETAEDRWRELMRAQDKTPLNTADLAESLRLYCVRICPDWEKRQFDPDTSALFNRCLSLISAITTADEVDLWREKTKLIMKMHLTSVPRVDKVEP